MSILDSTNLIDRLNDFDAGVRAQALQALVDSPNISFAPVTEVANMHCHTFYSFNAYGYSPAGLAWLARERGYKLLGIVDFDVLDAVDEFLDACELLEVRGSAGIETRLFVPEFGTREINSPGEPGVLYSMGIGFTSSTVPESAAPLLADLRDQATARNLRLIERINVYLDPVALDYELDVLPLTPGGNATERHIVSAYIAKAEAVADAPVAFWAEKLELSRDQVEAVMEDEAKLQNTVRAKLMKRGGVGYVQPGNDTFPKVEQFHKLITACGALPCAAWLDGLSEGEQAMDELLQLMIDKGAVALNIVPDRNWDIADAEVKAVKLQNLYDVVALAQKMDLPLNIGTEMNSPGLKLMDDFDAPELAPVRQAFLDGAYFIYGHTIMQRKLGMGYQSKWASQMTTRRKRNDFYTAVGKAVPPGAPGTVVLSEVSEAMKPADVLAKLAG